MEITIIRDRRKSKRSSAGRRKSDNLSGHIPGVVTMERWQIIDRALDDIGPDEDRKITSETWAMMSERDRALFAKHGPKKRMA